MALKIGTDDKGIKIYAKEKTSQAGNSWMTYSTSVNSKDKDGNWQTAFINVGFKKGVTVNNKAVIKIKNAFLTTEKWGDNKPTLKLFIMDFDVIEQGEGGKAPDTSFMDIPDDLMENLPFK